jgi:hypothetical protein
MMALKGADETTAASLLLPTLARTFTRGWMEGRGKGRKEQLVVDRSCPRALAFLLPPNQGSDTDTDFCFEMALNKQQQRQAVLMIQKSDNNKRNVPFKPNLSLLLLLHVLHLDVLVKDDNVVRVGVCDHNHL